MRWVALVLAVIAVSACDTYVPPRYSISADNNAALKNADMGSISVGTFSGPKTFNNACRAAGPISPPDGMTFAQYIQDALADELKIADRFADGEGDVTLSGTVEQLAFSSSRGLTGGSWDIGLRVDSSNGRSMVVAEHYEFKSGFVATTACKQTAEAFVPAVQNLIGTLINSRNFPGLVSP